MTIYIDVLFFLNAVINTVIIWVTATILKRRLKPLRFLITLTMCCLYGLIVCLPEFGFMMNTLIKAAFALVAPAVCFGVRPLKAYIKSVFVFFAVTAAYSAILTGLQYLPFVSDSVIVKNGAVYFNLPVIYIFVAAGIMCLIQLIVCRIFDRHIPSKAIVDCKLVVNGKSCRFKGFIDTGNFLKETVSGLPVVTVDSGVLKQIIAFDGDERFPIDENSPMRTRYRAVPYRTIDGKSGLLQGFRPDGFYVDGKAADVMVAVNPGVSDKEGIYSGIVPAIG